MHKIYEYEGERYVRLEDYEKSTKLLKAEIRNLKDDLDKIDRDVSINGEGHYESLLMKLSIQDEPIRFLCEILK